MKITFVGGGMVTNKGAHPLVNPPFEAPPK